MKVACYQPEIVTVARDEDGILRFQMGTREGLEYVGFNGGLEIRIKAKHFREGTTITVEEPLDE